MVLIVSEGQLTWVHQVLCIVLMKEKNIKLINELHHQCMCTMKIEFVLT